MKTNEADAAQRLDAAYQAIDENRDEEGEALLRGVITAYPECAEAYLQLGRLFEAQDRLEESRVMLERGLAVEEQQPFLTLLGSVQRRLGDPEAAQASLMRSLELNDADDEAHYAIGLALLESSPLAAVSHFEKALGLDPSLPHARREMARALWKAGQLEAAETVARQAIDQDTEDAWAHNYLGRFLQLRNEYNGAKIEFVAAMELAPDNGFFIANVADICDLLGECADAERLFIRALEVDMQDPHVNARYGLYLRRHGYPGKARIYLERALDIDPEQRRAQEALDELKQPE